MALFAVRHGWEVIEVSRWTDGHIDWAGHAEICRSWEQRFGAEVASIDFASIDFFVPRPPGRGVAVFELALEICGYGDSFNDDFATVNEIASSVAVSTAWRFWFD